MHTSSHSWQKISATSRWKGLNSKIWPIDQTKCRSTKKSADRPTLLADGKKTRPLTSCLGRWVAGMAYKPPSSLRSKTTSPWSTIKHKTDKLRDPKARHAAETSENSKRTRAWMIIECSNNDVQVLRTVKNGLSTYASIIQLFHTISLRGPLHVCRHVISNRSQDLGVIV